MRYYSDVLNELFVTEKELDAAENEFLLKREKEKKAAQEKEAQKRADMEKIANIENELKAILKDYFDAVADYNKKYKDKIESLKIKYNGNVFDPFLLGKFAKLFL